MAKSNQIYWRTYRDLNTVPDDLTCFLSKSSHGTLFQNPRWYLQTSSKASRYSVLSAFNDHRPVFAALIYESPIPGTRHAVGTIPRGPVFDSVEQAIELWNDFEDRLKGRNLCSIEVNPFWERTEAWHLTAYLQNNGYATPSHNIEHIETLTMDLTRSEEDLFKSLTSARRNMIRKALKMGIRVDIVRNSADMTIFWEMYRDMCQSKGIQHWSCDMFQNVRTYSLAYPNDCVCLMGWYNDILIGGNIILRHADIAELTRGGGSPRVDRSVPKTDLIIWEGIRWAKRIGAKVFDLGGITPDAKIGSPEQGINQYKGEFSRNRVPLFQPMIKVFQANHYGIYQSLKKIKKVMGKHTRLFLPN